MHNQKNAGSDSVFFRIIIFIVILSLFTSTTVHAYSDDSSFLIRVLKSMYSILFDTSVDATSGTSDSIQISVAGGTGTSDTTSITSRDPLDVPPTPPPPTSY
jgi:hypothetical protein